MEERRRKPLDYKDHFVGCNNREHRRLAEGERERKDRKGNGDLEKSILDSNDQVEGGQEVAVE